MRSEMKVIKNQRREIKFNSSRVSAEIDFLRKGQRSAPTQPTEAAAVGCVKFACSVTCSAASKAYIGCTLVTSGCWFVGEKTMSKLKYPLTDVKE